jgi:hypothetical protein
MRGRAISLMLVTSLLLVCRGAFAGPAEAPDPSRERWVKLGETPAGSGLETGTFEVGSRIGAFERLRIAAAGTDVFVQELRVYFADGHMQRVTRDARLARNTQSEPFLLDNSPRAIDRIEMTFKGRAPAAQRDALVSVWAQAASRQRDELVVLEDDWLVLGEKPVAASISQSVIAVGREAGRFEAIRLAVLSTDVAFHDIRVVYLDGEVDTLAVRRLIRAGDTSPPLTLKGPSRFIREIELIQEANPNTQLPAVVQVLARRSSAMR